MRTDARAHRPRLAPQVHPRGRRSRPALLHPRARGRRALRPADGLLQRRRPRAGRARHRGAGAQRWPHAAGRRVHPRPARDRGHRAGRSAPCADREAPRHPAARTARCGGGRCPGAAGVDGGPRPSRREGRGALRPRGQAGARQRHLPREDRHRRRPRRQPDRLDRQPQRDRRRLAAQLGEHQRLHELGPGARAGGRRGAELRAPVGQSVHARDRARRAGGGPAGT